MRGLPKEVNIIPGSLKETEAIESIKGTYGEYVLEFLKAKSMKKGNWLIAKVYDKDRKEIWSFKATGFQGRGQMFIIGDEPVIGFINRNDVLVDVDFFTDITNTIPATDGKMTIILGGKTLKQKISAKIQISKQEKIRYELSSEEKAFSDKELKIRSILAQKARDEAEKAYNSMREEILGRKDITVYSADGQTLFGTPVTSGEWKILPVGKYGVLVESFDKIEQTSGKPLKAFLVKAGKGGQKEMVVKSEELSLKKFNVEKSVPVLEVVEVRDFFLGNELIQVPVVAPSVLDEIKTLINSGSKVAVRAEGTADNIYNIYTLVKGIASIEHESVLSC